MSTLPERFVPSALRPKAPVSERDFYVFVDNENWTPYLKDVKFRNTGNEGASMLTFEARRPMDGYEDARVELWIAKAQEGWLSLDDYRLYFAGNLNRPMPDSPWPGATAQALGPFAAMMGQPLGEDLHYTGETLAHSLYDISRRAYTVSGIVEVVGGNDIVIEKGDFAQEVTLMEAARSLCNPSGYRMTDTRGLKRLYFPEPQPGSTGKSRAFFGPRDYGPGDLKISDVHSTTYYKVVVFRRSEFGIYEVKEEALVEAGRIARPEGILHKKRIYYIPDFPGTPAQAKDLAHKQAQKLAMGEYTLDGLTVDYDPDLYRFDQITVWRERERRDGIWREAFNFITEGGLDLDLSSDKMGMAGFGPMVDEDWVRPVRIVVPRASPSVLVAPYEYPTNPRDTLVVGDQITRRVNMLRTVSDGIAVGDARTAIKNQAAAIQRPVADAVSVADNIVVGITGGGEPGLGSFVIPSGPNDIYVGYADNTYPPTTADAVWTGTTVTSAPARRGFTLGAYYTFVALLRFDTSSIPNAAVITAADLVFVIQAAVSDANGLKLRAEWYSWDGVLNAARDFADPVGVTAHAGKALSTMAGIAGTAYTMTLLNPTSVNKSGYTTLRLGISQRTSDAAPTGNNAVYIATLEHASYAAPTLNVEYTL